MPQYTLLSYLPVDFSPSPEAMRDQRPLWMQFDQDLKDAGVLVANAGLAGVDAATTVRVRDGETQLTDGPFAETKEYLAGFWVIDVPDLDRALEWAARMPSSAHGSVEARPLWGTAQTSAGAEPARQAQA
jgi:hypothetical protein